VAKSIKERRHDELRAAIDELRRHLKSHEFVEVETSFDKLNKLVEKNTAIWQQDGTKVPRAYIKTLALLEDSFNKQETKGKTISNAYKT
jgi:hypothetical protein